MGGGGSVVAQWSNHIYSNHRQGFTNGNMVYLILACGRGRRYPLTDKAFATVVFAALEHARPIVPSANLAVHLLSTRVVSSG